MLEATQQQLNLTRSNASVTAEQLVQAQQAISELMDEEGQKEHDLALELESVRQELNNHWEDEVPSTLCCSSLWLQLSLLILVFKEFPVTYKYACAD